MNNITFETNAAQNILTLRAHGSYDQTDLEPAVSHIISNPKDTLGVILDLREGFPVYPKEQVNVYGRLAQEAGIKFYCLAVLVNPEDAFDLKHRYTEIARYFKAFIETDVKFFTQEDKAKDWVTTHPVFQPS